MPELSTLDERLAEIDARLRTLQSGLDGAPPPPSAPPVPTLAPTPLRSAPPLPPEPEPEPPAPSPLASPATASDAPDGPERMLAELRELSAAHERLLELHRDLLSQYAELLERRVAETPPVSLVTGPFADGAALRAFEHDLGGLPGVREVTTREFLSGDRVALDVRLTTS